MLSTSPPAVHAGTWEDLQRLIDGEMFMDTVRMLHVGRARIAHAEPMLRDAVRALATDDRAEQSIVIVDCGDIAAGQVELDQVSGAQRAVSDAPHVFLVAGHDAGRARTPQAPLEWYWHVGESASRHVVEDDTGVYGTYGLARDGLQTAVRFLDAVGALPAEANVFIDGDHGPQVNSRDWSAFLEELFEVSSRNATVMVPARQEGFAYAAVRRLADGCVLLKATPPVRGPDWAFRLVDNFDCSTAVVAYVDPPESGAHYEAMMTSSQVAWVVESPVPGVTDER